MSCNVCTCKEDDDITNAQTQMSQNQIRRLPVCNSKNEVVGILTLGDLAQNTQSIGQQQVNETIENIGFIFLHIMLISAINKIPKIAVT